MRQNIFFILLMIHLGAKLTKQTFHILQVDKFYILILSSFDTCQLG